MVLTNKQKEDLHQAIAQYLKSQNFTASYAAFLQESSTEEVKASDKEGALERKWSSLSKYVSQNKMLEEKIKQLNEELSGASKMKKLGGDGAKDGLPKIPEKYTLKGHQRTVTKVLFHPTYSVVASSSEDGTIKVFDYESGDIEKTLKGHVGKINCIAFGPDGKLLASCSSDLTIKIWNFESFECMRTLNGHGHDISCVEFIPSGDFLLSCSRDKTIKMWEVSSGFCVKTFSGHAEWVKKLRVNDLGTLMASCSKDQTIHLWSLEAANKANPLISILNEHEHVIECIAFANEEAAAIINESDYNKKGAESTDLFSTKENHVENNSHEESKNAKEEVKKGEEKKEELTIEQKRDQLLNKKKQILEEGKVKLPEFIASGSRDKLIKLWNLTTSKCILTIKGHDMWVLDVAFHSNGKFLLSASEDKSIRVWDLSNGGRMVKKIEGAHTNWITTIAMNRRFPVLASGSIDTNVKIWECR